MALVRTALRWLLCGAGLAAIGCSERPTSALVELDTDVPRGQPIRVEVTVHDGQRPNSAGATQTWVFDAVSGSLGLPTSFGITPAPGEPLDGPVVLELDAAIEAGPSGEPGGTIHRDVRFAFQPHETVTIPVFLARACTAASTGCDAAHAASCTVSESCAERGQTCGDLGSCVDPSFPPRPGDGGLDAGVDGGPGMDSGVDAQRPDVARPDTAQPDVACPSGMTRCAGACVSLSSDIANCGSCGRACPTNSQCSAGTCVCDAALTLCGTRCVNLQSNPSNCGACGNSCGGIPCRAATCQCDPGTTMCGGRCANLSTDSNNCGTCGTQCPTLGTCSSGACRCNNVAYPTLCPGASQCVNLQHDRSNCGACGDVCAAGASCLNGVCS